MPTIGRRIKDIRTILRIRNQEEMASILGTATDALIQIEAGKISPSDEFLERLEKRLGVSGAWLMTGEGSVLLREEPLLFQQSQVRRDTGHTMKQSRSAPSEGPVSKTLGSGDGPPGSNEEESTHYGETRTMSEGSQIMPSLQFFQHSQVRRNTGHTMKVSRSEPSEAPASKTPGPGDGPSSTEDVSTNHRETRTMHEESQTIPSMQFRQLPVVTFKVAAGKESFSTAHLDPKQPFITISENDGPERTDLVAIRVSGRNMEPTIRDGAIACVDRGDKAISPQNIYAVHNGQGKGAVRRLSAVAGGLVLLPDNREFEVETLALSSGQDPEDFIIGKVISVWQSFV